MPHSIAAKSPTARAVELQLSDIFPSPRTMWSPYAGKPLVRCRHMAAFVHLLRVPATYLVLSSPTLRPALLVDAPLPLDALALRGHNPNHLSDTFQEWVPYLLDRLATCGKELKTDLHHRATVYVTHFNLEIRSASTEIFLMILSADQDTHATPPIPLLH